MSGKASEAERSAYPPDGNMHPEQIIRLMNRISATPGLDNTAKAILQVIADTMGGSTLSLTYRLGDLIFRADAFGNQQRLEVIGDELVQKAFETRKPVEQEQAAAGFAGTFTWALPLLAGEKPVAVVRIEGLAMREMPRPLPPLFQYAAFVLENEILQTLLRKEHAAKAARVRERAPEMDITGRKRFEERLLKSEERMRLFFERQLVGMAITSPDRGWLQVNDKVCEMLGYSRDELAHMTWAEMTYPEDLAADLAQFERLLRGEIDQYTLEKRYVHKDGHIVYGNLSVGCVRKADGTVDYTLSLLEDITERKRAEEVIRTLNSTLEDRVHERTAQLKDAIAALNTEIAERKQAEEALRESEERFKGMVEQASVSIQIFDPSGRTLHVNKAYEKLWGLSLDDALRYNILEDPQIEKLGILPDLKRGFSGESCKIKRVEYDPVSTLGKGRKRWVEGHIYSVKDERGKLRNLILMHEDVTERVRAEEALNHAKEAAEAANRAKDQFIAVLSHELRTPLTPVLATVSALEEQGDLPPDLQTDVELIRRNVELEARLIDDLLDVTKISRGQIELRLESVDVHLVLRTVLEICQQDIESKRINISLGLHAGLHQVLADPTRLRQVFWNLIKNAVEFTPEGGEINLRTTNVDRRLRIEIKDTGAGIRPELLPKIFNAFERGDRPSSRRFGGLGLGLSIAKTVTDMHHGTLVAFSEGRGKGSTFTVELPVIRTPAEPAPPAVSKLVTGKTSAKILLVDDHPDTLRTMSRLLNKWGYTVVCGDCVQAALALAAREHFDLLISDLGLPDGSGLEIMRRLKERQDLHGIAFSGYGTDEDVRQSREAGFDVHLIKPVSFQTLREAIQRTTSKLDI